MGTLHFSLIFSLIYLASFALGGPTYVVTRDEGQPLLGSKKCTYGPSYWCHNITQAKECKAMKHCINVWEGVKLPEDNDSVCQVCKEMVKEARDQLLSNETQDELRQVLEGSCQLIPLKLVANECSDLMDNFIPELVDALVSRMDPQVVCAVSGLCNSDRIDKMLNETKTIKLSPSCPRCNHFMSMAFNSLRSEKKDDLKMKMLEACGHLSSYSDSCRMAVIEEFDQIYGQITHADSKEFCQLIGVCDENNTGTELAIYNDDLPCDFCKQLVNYARTWLMANSTKEDFDKIVQGLCRRCPAKDKCVEFYQKYGAEIYQLLVDDFEADSFCSRIGICPNGNLLNGQAESNDVSPVWTILKSSVENDDEEHPMLELTPGESLIGNDEKNSLKVPPKCIFCEYVIQQVQNYLDSPQTEMEVKEVIDHLCDRYLPKDMSEQCDEFITNYGDSLIDLLTQEINSTEICPKLKLCPMPKDILPTCKLCEFAITKVINMIGKNRTTESIEEATEKVCEMMPKKYYKECQNFMKNYGDQVLEMILIEGSSREICAALHLCLYGAEQIEEKIIVQSPLPFELYVPSTLISNDEEETNEDTKCVICEYVITTLASKIKDNATEEEIKEELEQVCGYLPNTVKKNCKNFVEMYGDLVISYLAQEMNPAQVCTELNLCKQKRQYQLTLSRCELCNVMTDYISMKLEDPKFVNNGINIVTGKFCPLLRNLKTECTEMMEDYGPYMMSLLTEKRDKDQVCKEIDLC